MSNSSDRQPAYHTTLYAGLNFSRYVRTADNFPGEDLLSMHLVPFMQQEPDNVSKTDKKIYEHDDNDQIVIERGVVKVKRSEDIEAAIRQLSGPDTELVRQSGYNDEEIRELIVAHRSVVLCPPSRSAGYGYYRKALEALILKNKEQFTRGNIMCALESIDGFISDDKAREAILRSEVNLQFSKINTPIQQDNSQDETKLLQAMKNSYKIIATAYQKSQTGLAEIVCFSAAPIAVIGAFMNGTVPILIASGVLFAISAATRMNSKHAVRNRDSRFFKDLGEKYLPAGGAKRAVSTSDDYSKVSRANDEYSYSNELEVMLTQ